MHPLNRSQEKYFYKNFKNDTNMQGKQYKQLYEHNTAMYS